MTLIFEKEVETKFDFDEEKLADEIIEKFLDYIECEWDVEAGLLITDSESIQRINSEQRGIDSPTDVLSFPMLSYVEPGDLSFIDDDDNDCFNPDSGELMLGDIVLSYDRIIAQAEEFGHSVKREYSFLIVHSLLHLFGYDHIADEDRVVMEEKQREFMEILGISR